MNFFWSPSHAAAKIPEIYDAIADSFSETRNQIWPELRLLFEKTLENSKILDIGCGNGRLIPFFREKNCEITGIDISEKLLEISRKKYPECHFQKGDLLSLPFPDETFDEVWAIAVFHHLPRISDREKAFQEMYRVLKKNGSVVLTVWNLLEEERYQTYKYWAFFRSLFLPQWRRNDFLIPWSSKSAVHCRSCEDTERVEVSQKKFLRYYHAFTPDELRTLGEKNGFLLEQMWTDHHDRMEAQGSHNICIRFRKKNSFLCSSYNL